jgi:transcriptional regulator with XRE-family HTH domain
MNNAGFAQMIINKRVELGDSQEEFGKRFGVTQQAVFNWESAKALPGKRILRELCEIMGIQYGEVAALKRHRISNVTAGDGNHIIAGDMSIRGSQLATDDQMLLDLLSEKDVTRKIRRRFIAELLALE